MSNINSIFEVRKSSDQEVVIMLPAGIKVDESINAKSLLKSMMELALEEELDVAGQGNLVYCCGNNGGCCRDYPPKS